MLSISTIRSIWATAELVIEELIIAAEELLGSKTGPEKKAFVVKNAVDWLKQLEAKKNLIPGALEGIVFQAIEFSLGWMVERVLTRLKLDGQVPSGSVEGAAA